MRATFILRGVLPRISRVFSEALLSSTYGSSAIASVPSLSVAAPGQVAAADAVPVRIGRSVVLLYATMQTRARPDGASHRLRRLRQDPAPLDASTNGRDRRPARSATRQALAIALPSERS